MSFPFALCPIYSLQQLLTDYQPVPIQDGQIVSIPESWSSDPKKVIGSV